MHRHENQVFTHISSATKHLHNIIIYLHRRNDSIYIYLQGESMYYIYQYRPLRNADTDTVDYIDV